MEQITEERLLEFIHLIAKNSPTSTIASTRITQLKAIMVQQNADPRLLELLDIAASEPSDVCSLSRNAQSLTAVDLETIRIRAEERRARARMHSRC